MDRGCPCMKGTAGDCGPLPPPAPRACRYQASQPCSCAAQHCQPSTQRGATHPQVRADLPSRGAGRERKTCRPTARHRALQAGMPSVLGAAAMPAPAPTTTASGLRRLLEPLASQGCARGAAWHAGQAATEGGGWAGGKRTRLAAAVTLLCTAGVRVGSFLLTRCCLLLCLLQRCCLLLPLHALPAHP